AELVDDLCDHVAAVDLVVERLRDLDLPARGEPRAVRLDRERAPRRLLRLEAHLAEALALGGLHVEAREIVDLEIGVEIALGLGGEIELGALEIVVAEREL